MEELTSKLISQFGRKQVHTTYSVRYENILTVLYNKKIYKIKFIFVYNKFLACNNWVTASEEAEAEPQATISSDEVEAFRTAIQSMLNNKTPLTSNNNGGCPIALMLNED